MFQAKTSKLSVKLALRRACRDILFAFAYPRLDVEVSRKMNHLLKAPFCVHPKTGKVSCPVTATQPYYRSCTQSCACTTAMIITASAVPMLMLLDWPCAAQVWQRQAVDSAVVLPAEWQAPCLTAALTPAPLCTGFLHLLAPNQLRRCRMGRLIIRRVQHKLPPCDWRPCHPVSGQVLHICMRSPTRYLYLQVCVPIDPETAEQFDPVDGVPMVAELLTELDKQALAAQSALVGLC